MNVAGGRARIEINRAQCGPFILERPDSLGSIDWQPVVGAIEQVDGGCIFLVDLSRRNRKATFECGKCLQRHHDLSDESDFFLAALHDEET